MAEVAATSAAAFSRILALRVDAGDPLSSLPSKTFERLTDSASWIKRSVAARWTHTVPCLSCPSGKSKTSRPTTLPTARQAIHPRSPAYFAYCYCPLQTIRWFVCRCCTIPASTTRIGSIEGLARRTKHCRLVHPFEVKDNRRIGNGRQTVTTTPCQELVVADDGAGHVVSGFGIRYLDQY